MKGTKRSVVGIGMMLALTAGCVAANGFRSIGVSAEAAGEDVVINNESDFKAFFNKAGLVANSITLNADLDFSDDDDYYIDGLGKDGQLNGLFEGNGHSITGLKYKQGSRLFHLIGSTGTIQNLSIEWTALGTHSAGFCYQNNGTIRNSVSTMHILDNTPLGVWGPAGFSYSRGTGAYENNKTVVSFDFADPTFSEAGKYPGVLVGEDNPTINGGNKYSIVGTGAANGHVRENGANLMVPVSAINVSDASAELYPAEHKDVTLSMTGTEYESVTWSTNADGVATVSGDASGARITAVGAGSATITVSVDVDGVTTLSKTISVTVLANAPVTGVSLNNASTGVLFAEDTFDVSAILSGSEYSSIVWSSDDTDVATVAGNGLNAVVTAVSAGTTTVTVSVTSSNETVYEAELSVTVGSIVRQAFDVAATPGYNWNGAGFKFNAADLPSYSKDAYDSCVVTVTGTANVGSTNSGWHFEDGTYLYVNFPAAPAQSDVYSFHYELTKTSGSTRTIYTFDLSFEGTTVVFPEGSISGSSSLTVDENADFTASFTHYSGATYAWSVSNSNIISISESTTDTVTVTGVAVGSANLIASITFNGKQYQATKSITVTASAADVDEISLSIADASIIEENQTTVSASLTGQLYNSFEWQSLNTSVATVSGGTIDGVTVTGVAAGSTSIKMIVHTDSGDVQQTVEITVTAALRTKVYAAVPHSFAYGGAVTIFGGNAIEYKTLTTDTGFDITYGGTEYDLVVADINLTKAGKANNDNTDIIVGVHAQMEQAVGAGRYGNGIAVSTKDGLAFVVNGAGNESYASLGTGAEMEGVLNFCKNYMKSDTIALDNGDSTEDCAANYAAAKTALAGLNAAQKLMFTYTAYYERLQNWAIANSETLVIDGEGQIQSAYPVKIQSTSDNGGAIALVAITMIAMASFAGYALYSRKRKAE